MTSKPKDFIFNSDWLSMSESTRQSFTAYFAPQQYPTSSTQVLPFYIVRDFTVPTTSGGVDKFQITYGGQTFWANSLAQPPVWSGASLTDYSESWVFNLYRTSPTNIRARIDFMPDNQSHTTPPSSPALTFNFSVDSFNAPNVL